MFDLFSNPSFLFLLAINMIAAIGMNIVYATGQLNLGQAGFMAIGAYTVAVTDRELGWPLAASLLAGALVSAALALPVAYGANRVRGIHLIMGTLAVGEVVRIVIGNLQFLGGLQGYSGITPVDLEAVVAILLLTLVAASVLMASPLGLKMRAIFDDEDAAAAAGVNTRLVKIISVVLSAAVVAVAGGLMAKWLLFIAPHNFGIDLSFRVALFSLIGGVHSLLGALVGAFLVTYLVEALRVIGGAEATPVWLQFVGPWRLVIYGAAVMVLMAVRPEGLISRQLALTLTRPLRRLRRARLARAPQTGPDAGKRAPTQGNLLDLQDVTHDFGGVRALQDVTLFTVPKEIVVLIGANGAGKTTLNNVVSGRYRLQSGRIFLQGEDMSRMPAYRRVLLGIARTFQSVRPFSHLTVEENIRLGQLATGARPVPPAQDIIAMIGLDGKLETLPEQLTLAEQRRLEIGRAISSAPHVIFLDEPSVGMNEVERLELAELIRQVRERGASVILIDHNLDLAFSLADRVAVLDFGSLIRIGTPQEVVDDPQVRYAYLGATEVEL